MGSVGSLSPAAGDGSLATPNDTGRSIRKEGSHPKWSRRGIALHCPKRNEDPSRLPRPREVAGCHSTTSWCSRGPCPTLTCRPHAPALSSRKWREAGRLLSLLCGTVSGATEAVTCLAASERSHPWPFPFLPAVPSLVTAVSCADERERPRGAHLCGEEGKEQRALGDRTGQAQT